MKNIILLSLLVISFSLNAQEQTRDVLYLKNGSVIKGTVTEMNPSTGIKIKTADGSLFVYKMDEILKTEKEKFVGETLNQNTSSSVSQKALDNHFITFFNEKRQALKFIGVSKINGVNREVFGQKIREIEYELIIEAKQDLFISDIMSINGNGFKKDFSYLKSQPTGWDAQLNVGIKKLAKGQRVVANGTINFEETDNGWRAKGFNNKNYKTVSSDYTSPQLEQQQAENKAKEAENKAKLEEQIKADLDWRGADIKPVEFISQYFSMKNVPYFRYANIKYYITTSPSYKGRNDLAAKIQTAFFQALNSTNRQQSDTRESFTNSVNQANFTLIISSVDFIFKDTGYQCQINVNGRAKGTYYDPNTIPFNYNISLPAKSNGYKKNISKAEAFNLALENFEKVVRGMNYTYGSIEIEFVRIVTNKRGKVDQIVFKKPENFINASKMKFILMKPENLVVSDATFKITGKIGECMFKGEATESEVICEVSGAKNKKAISEYLNTKEQLIGLSSY
jgi:hypothetical protein